MAVEPILASSIWNAQGATSSTSTEPPAKRRRLATACPPIDTCLNGGFEYGTISCISAEAESGSKEISYSLIAPHLLGTDHSQATVIDTTNSFDVRRLHKRLVSTLREKVDVDDAKAEAVRVLERVRIMKAFDFVGMTECVAELREGLENSQQVAVEGCSIRKQDDGPAPRGTVGDSEDEDEMLDEPSSQEKATAPPIEPSIRKEAKDGLHSLLIIDNITYVTSPLLKNSHVQGQALLTTFMRSLAHLTQTHDVCTVTHNTTVSYQANPANSAAESTPSIFSSCSLRPALGKTFANLLDLHVLLHKIPMTPADAKIVYSTHAAVPQLGQRLASVLEVMQDRHEDRVGHWAPFRVDADGNLATVSAS